MGNFLIKDELIGKDRDPKQSHKKQALSEMKLTVSCFPVTNPS